MTELVNVLALAIFVSPVETVTDCRDVKDDKYLELALAADAEVIVGATTTCLCCTRGAAFAFRGQPITWPRLGDDVHDSH